jgi:hypothetical protein
MIRSKFIKIKNITEIIYTTIILIVGIMSLMIAAYIVFTNNTKDADLSSFARAMDVLINSFIIFSIVKIVLLSYEIFKPEVQ